MCIYIYAYTVFYGKNGMQFLIIYQNNLLNRMTQSEFSSHVVLKVPQILYLFVCDRT